MSIRTAMIIDGKYRLVKEIGRGGMSVVYLAVDTRLKKEWAVKEIRRQPAGAGYLAGAECQAEEGQMDAAERSGAYRQLTAEAALMRKWDHPAFPRIVDIVEQGDRIYIVMDYIRGVSLDTILREKGAQREETVIGWGIQLCDALCYLHGQRPPVIYRDMKPANVLLTAQGMLKLVDFGISREYKERRAADTALLGTRGYAPPEQHGLRQTDVRSDIYALGMTLHHLLTGRDPAKAGYRYQPVREIVPSLSEEIEAIIDRCTALDPAMRYQNCRELLYDLQHPQESGSAAAKRAARGRHLLFLAAVAAGILSVAGIAGHTLNVSEAKSLYEQRISVSASAPYETKIASYLEAIRLFGEDPRGYRLLLAAYREQGIFGERESQQFTGVYDAHKAEMDRDSTDYLDLLYDAGITYFYLYTGKDGSGDRFVSRVQKSYPYFREIAASGNEGYQYYDISVSYAKIGEFYAGYVSAAAGVREPDREVYDGLLQAFGDCLDAAADYEAADGTYVRLTMYRAVADLLNSYRQGFAAAGVPKEAVRNILEKVWLSTEGLYVSQQRSMDLREEILRTREEYAENLERAYENAAKWKDAEE